MGLTFQDLVSVSGNWPHKNANILYSDLTLIVRRDRLIVIIKTTLNVGHLTLHFTPSVDGFSEFHILTSYQFVKIKIKINSIIEFRVNFVSRKPSGTLKTMYLFVCLFVFLY